MEANKRMYRFLSYDLIKGSGTFWIVMILVNLITGVLASYSNLNPIIGPMIRDEVHISFAGSNIFAVFIFLIVYCIEMYYESFSLAIGFGATRKNFYINAIINNFIIALIFGIIQIVLMKIDIYIVSRLGLQPFVDYGLFNLEKDSLAVSILLLSFVFFIFISVMNLIGILQYRFSYKFWIGFGIFVFVSQILTNGIGRLIKGITNLQVIFSIGSFLSIGILIILLAYSIGFFLIRKVNIK